MSCFGVRLSSLDRVSLFSAFRNSTAEGKCFDSFFSEANFESKFLHLFIFNSFEPQNTFMFLKLLWSKSSFEIEILLCTFFG